MRLSITGAIVAVLAVGLLAANPAAAEEGNVRFENEKMYVDGKPFFYWGFIWRNSSLETLKQYGFNACLARRRDQEEFDRAAELGFHLMIPHYDETAPPAAWMAQHPATIAWFLMDDANSPEHAKQVQGIVNQVRKVDPTHPTLVDLNGMTVEADLRFVDIIDIYAPYWYPLPTRGYRWYFDHLDERRDGVGRKYMWSAIQCSAVFSYHASLGFTWSDQLKYPAPGQFRLFCWGLIAHGMRGFMFWPEEGLLPANNDIGDRTAEAIIMAHELEIIGGEIVAGDEVRDGARCADPDIDLARIDLPDHTILIASVIRDNYEYAMDEAVADVEISLPRPPQLAGELRAYSFGFPQIEEVRLCQKGDQLIVGPHQVEISDVIIIEEAGACHSEHAAQIKQHLPAVAAAAQSLLRYLHAKMDYVHRHLVNLDVDLPQARVCAAEAVRLKEQSAKQFDDGRFAASFASARAAQRNYRQMLWEYREYAEQFKGYTTGEMHLYLQMPYELPRYFASFDHTAVGKE